MNIEIIKNSEITSKVTNALLMSRNVDRYTAKEIQIRVEWAIEEDIFRSKFDFYHLNQTGTFLNVIT